MSILREELITNHLLLDYFDLWDEFDIKSSNDTYEVRYYNQLMNLINGQLDAGIRWLDSEEAREYFFGESEYQREVFRALEDEWDSILEGKYSSVDALLSEVYRRGKAKGYTDMRSRIRYTEQDKLALAFVQEYNFGLIRNIDNDVRSQIKGKIVSGFLAGDHPNTIAPKILQIAQERLDGSNFTPKQRATMIARTEVSRVQNTGILQSYVNEGFTEVKILTAEDNNVCDLCLRYAFEFIDDEIIFENRGEERVHNISKLIKGGLFPPFHPLCRCTYQCVWGSKGEPPVDAEVVDLTVGEQTSLDSFLHKQDKFDDEENSRKIAEELGYTYTKRKDNGNEVFTDNDTGVELRFSKKFLETLDEMNDNIEIQYSKYDILKMFKDSPKLFKQVSNIILFSTFNRTGDSNTTGYYDPVTKDITILPHAFRFPPWTPTNLNVTLYHEMSHALDHKKAKSGNRYGLSADDTIYLNYILEDNAHQHENYGRVVYVSKHVKKYGIHEDFAESLAMTQLLLEGKNKSPIVRLTNGEKITLNEWKERFPNRYEYCKNILENTSLKSFIRFYINQVFKNAFS